MYTAAERNWFDTSDFSSYYRKLKLDNLQTEKEERKMSDKTSKKLDYVGKMILAPMVKIGTLPTRLLALDYGADLVYTEEIIDYKLIKSTRIENELLGTVDYIDETDGSLTLRVAPERERGHLVLQIGTNNPERAVKVAKMVEKGTN